MSKVKAPPAQRSTKRRTEKPVDGPADEVTGTDTATAGGPVSTASETDIDRLSARLKSFGFDVPVALIGQWDGPTFTNIELTGSRWQNEFDRANSSEVIPEAERTPIPPMLATMEAVTPDQAKFAQDAATVAATTGDSVDCNLYTPGSGLAVIWRDAYTAAKSSAPADATPGDAPVEVAPPVEAAKVASTPQISAAEAAELNAKREADVKADRARQQQLAIEAAQHDMEEAVTHQEELAEQIIDMKAEMKELKSAYDNAVVRGQKAAKALRRARNGVFERTLPFPKEQRDESLNVPDQDFGGNPAPAAPRDDEGAAISLDCLVKGQLQEYIPGASESLGLSEKQVEKLKESIGGDTIGKLEEFQRNKGEWWVKEISGFDKETITKLQDAQDAIRRKYPVPSPDDVVYQAEQAAPAEEPPEPMDFAIAEDRLAEIIVKCETVINESDVSEGVVFAGDVHKKASSMLESLQKSDKDPTLDQARAIRNWLSGIDAWFENLANDQYEDDDDLDVPDSDGDDE